MGKFYYSAPAAQDLYEIVEYIARDKPDAADRWLEKLDTTCQLLAENPDLGEKRSLRKVKCRSFVIGNYVIFYREISDGVDIIRIINGARDIESL